MVALPAAPVGAYLAELMTCLRQASPGPMRTSRRASGSIQVTWAAGQRRRPVATFAKAGDAAVFVRAVADLRALTGAVSEVLAHHHDGGDNRCAACQQSLPCTTVRVITTELQPRAGRR
jgi:hypothetical protein